MLLYLARHTETVYNSGARIQGHMAHIPLARAGISEAGAMGTAPAAHSSLAPDIDLWTSPSGQALQTISIVAEHLGRNFFSFVAGQRLPEIDIGVWRRRSYVAIVAQSGTVHRVSNALPPDGRWCSTIAARLQARLTTLGCARTALVTRHRIMLRALRGIPTGGWPFEGVTLAEDSLYGTVPGVRDGALTALHAEAEHSGTRVAA